jgi:hypothetical protein
VKEWSHSDHVLCWVDGESLGLLLLLWLVMPEALMVFELVTVNLYFLDWCSYCQPK